MKTGTLHTAALGLMVALGPVARASVIKPLVLGGDDSGWDVVLADDANTGVVVDAVGGDYVLIQIAKIYRDPPSGGRFTPNLIGFHQRLDDANTVPSIRIADEFVLNYTGAEWTDYHWRIVGGAAAFDRIATDAGGFSVWPFTVKSWGPAQVGWDADHPGALDVGGGVVADGSVFLPGSAGGSLWVHVDLSQPHSDFTLKQAPTPEPGTLVLVVAGGALAAVRRRRGARPRRS